MSGILVARSCPSNLSCPKCADNEECQLVPPTSSSCAKYICVKVTTGTSSSTPARSGTNAGAIAGGVVGGLLVVSAIIAFILWRFTYSSKARMRRFAKELENPEMSDVTPNVDAEEGYFESHRASMQEKARMSHATLSSVNSSYTRASNVIPIAYIPGVVSRPGEEPPPGHMHRGSIRDSRFYTTDNIRASIATTNYRGSTAFVHSEEIAAVNARPNLVQVVGGGKPTDHSLDTGVAKLAGSASAGGTGSVLLGSAEVMPGQRMNARSVRIGRNQPLGLQSQMIAEERSDEEDSDAELDRVLDVPPLPDLAELNARSMEPAGTKESADEEIFSSRISDADRPRRSLVEKNGSRESVTDKNVRDSINERTSSRHSSLIIDTTKPPPPSPTVPSPTAPSFTGSTVSVHRTDAANRPLSPPPQVPASRNRQDSASSKSSVGTVAPSLRFSVQSGFDVPFVLDKTEGARNSTAETSSVRSSYHSANSRPASNVSRLSRHTSKRNTMQRESEYVATDLPIEALMYAKTQLEDAEGRASPFDDEHVIPEKVDK